MFDRTLKENKKETERKPDLVAVATEVYLTDEGRKTIWECLLGKEKETGK